VVTSLWRFLKFLFKGAGVMFAILGVLLLVGLIWFSLNPPFASPKTGALHAQASRDLRLAAGQTTLAIGLEARLNDNAMTPENSHPGPPSLRAMLVPTETGSLDGVRLRLAAGDATSAVPDVHESGGGVATGSGGNADRPVIDWTITCPAATGQGCRQVVVLLVDAAPSATERRWRLDVQGDLQYPAYTPTPGWSSFDVDLRAIGPETGTGPSPLSEAAGTIDLTATQPVVVVPLHVENGAAAGQPGGPPPAALRLVIDAVRLTETPPAGLDAPEPVRATVLAADGSIVARQGVRPGAGGRVLSLPVAACTSGCAIDYRIAFEWMDVRPDADYRLTWRVEAIGLPADGRPPMTVAARAGAPEVAAVASVAVPAAGLDPFVGQRVDVSVGGLPVVDGTMPPIHVQLRITATVDPAEEVGAGVVRIQPFANQGSGGDVPFDVNPGGTGTIAINFGDRCAGGLCDHLVLQASTMGQTGASPSAPLGVTWRLEARAWRLVPDPAPMNLTLDVR
jgi:hypothetical protein